MPRKIQDFAQQSLVKPILVNVGRAGAANLDVLQVVEYVKQEATTNGPNGKEARATRLITERASKRIGKVAFDLALARPRKVCSFFLCPVLYLTSVACYNNSQIQRPLSNRRTIPRKRAGRPKRVRRQV